MIRTLTKTTAFFATGMLFSLASRVEATPIVVAPGTPKQSVAITTSQNMGSASPGTLLATLTASLNIGGGHILGSVISAVYQNSAGFLDFYYQVVNTTPPGGQNNSVSGLAGFNFGSATTSVGYYSNASPFGSVFQTPNYFFGWEGRPRSADRSSDGNVVNLWFGPPWGASKIDPGEASSILMISTNARSWGYGWATVQNGGPASTDTVRSFQVPEPTSSAIALLGFAVLAGFRRRSL